MNNQMQQFGQSSPWCPHGLNQNEQRCPQCEPFPYGSARYPSESSNSILVAKLDAIYSKLEAIERMLKV